jgi:hypothetical protein
MSKKNGYVCLDKNLTQYMPSIGREYSLIEAVFSYSVDQDKGKIGTISGYSKLWKWSRHRVRNLLKNLHSETGHYPDRKQTLTRHPVHFIDVGLRAKPDTNPTLTRQNPDTTSKPKPKPIKKNNKKSSFPSGFKLTNAMIKYCMEKSHTKNPESMFEDFKNNHVSKGNKFVNWESAWQTWCRNDVKYNKPKDNSNLTLLQRAF